MVEIMVTVIELRHFGDGVCCSVLHDCAFMLCVVVLCCGLC